jgi:hypothetical protein
LLPERLLLSTAPVPMKGLTKAAWSLAFTGVRRSLELTWARDVAQAARRIIMREKGFDIPAK